MFANFILTIHLLVTLLAPVIAGVDITQNLALVAGLKAAATNLDRMALLSKDSDYLFDFYAQPKYTYNPGSRSPPPPRIQLVDLAQVLSMPMLQPSRPSLTWI